MRPQQVHSEAVASPTLGRPAADHAAIGTCMAALSGRQMTENHVPGDDCLSAAYEPVLGQARVPGRQKKVKK